MKIRIFVWAVCVLAVAAALFGLENLILQQQIAEKTLRLHVVANSNSQADQAHKLVVRDAVLAQVQTLTADCVDAYEAKTVILENLEQIARSAAQVSPYEIKVSLATERFPTRNYETFSLPAGEYPALRVQIGSAQGENWWCVVFPSLCTAATSDAVEQCAQVGGFEKTESDFISGGEDEYKLRFKTLEWLQKLRKIFS